MSEALDVKIVCPGCGGNCGTVKDSRPNEVYGIPTIRRRRRCDNCGQNTTTFEVPEPFLGKMRAEIAKEMVVSLL